MTIFKYPLFIQDKQTVAVPAGFTPLSVAIQYGRVTLWAQVEPRLPEQHEVDIYIIGTGHEVPDDVALKFVGTVQMADGQLVWHVFVGEDRIIS